ncbi:MAG: DUF1367 family protein [Spirochaetales bacterium]|jgi:hypothetical protein|nr:DUF1367 family protein [Spirochaetales bacterium]
MKAFFRKQQDGSWIPHDEKTEKYCNRRDVGQVLSGEFKIARNYENHKRFFSMIAATFDMQDFFKEQEAYRKWLILKAGYFETIVGPSGDVTLIPESMAFEHMDEDVFRQVFSAVIDAFLEHFGKGISYDDVMQVVSYG